MRAGTFLKHDENPRCDRLKIWTAVEATPRQLTDFLRSLRAVREFQRYPARPPRRGARKPISELVHAERYRA